MRNYAPCSGLHNQREPPSSPPSSLIDLAACLAPGPVEYYHILKLLKVQFSSLLVPWHLPPTEDDATEIDLVELEPMFIAYTTPRPSAHYRGHNKGVIQQIKVMDQAHLERKEAETVAIIAAAAAAQKAEEQRTLLEAASAADARNKEGWQAEHKRWSKEREDSVGFWGRAHCTSEVT
ncbi:hypothetical protein H4582DRAFT_2078898 [Lactarius indigo]|nr:hypothetical protein H4582DRAFT_2078898 [Lactarius indigo]